MRSLLMPPKKPKTTSYLFSSGSERRVEPLFERETRFENGRQQEVEKSPQFGQFILERRSGQQDAMGSVVEGIQRLK